LAKCGNAGSARPNTALIDEKKGDIVAASFDRGFSAGRDFRTASIPGSLQFGPCRIHSRTLKPARIH